MRKIETLILAAIRENRPVCVGNTTVIVIASDMLLVSLHGNVIARRVGDHWHWTLAGWNTVTTRSRLRALAYGPGWGCGPIVVQREPYCFVVGADARPISSRDWIDAASGVTL